MPLYDFVCASCSNPFTVRQGVHDKHIADCPTCGGTGQRQFTMPAVVFKGSGFYVNDYGGRSTPATSDSENKSENREELEADTPSASSSSEPNDTEAGAGTDATAHSHPHPHPHPDS